LFSIPDTNKEFTKILSKVLKARHSFNTSFFLDRLIGESSLLLTKGQRVHPKRLLEDGFSFQFFDLGAALRNTLKT
jgi:NAD dependent epimerase/dehydratase family enzyme